jgi:hypothetical protein
MNGQASRKSTVYRNTRSRAVGTLVSPGFRPSTFPSGPPDPNDAIGRLLFNVLAMIAELESDAGADARVDRASAERATDECRRCADYYSCKYTCGSS